jgi:trehalose 6-phosphate phosphatase
MQNIYTQWSTVKQTLPDKPIALFLDFDGTLAPIAPTPEEAVIPKENKLLLQKLSTHKRCKVTIVSGRSMEDLKNKLKLENIIYVGNHGLEIQGLRIHFENLLPVNMKRSIQEINDALTRTMTPIPGVVLENKALTLSLHYRLVEEKDIMPIKKIFIKICEPYRRKGEIQIRFGKKVLEVRPCIKWNKGHAVSWLLKKYSLAAEETLTPFYMGDDETDEDAFTILKETGYTVVVGNQPSEARYYVENTAKVTWLLEQILKWLDDRDRAPSLADYNGSTKNFSVGIL